MTDLFRQIISGIRDPDPAKRPVWPAVAFLIIIYVVGIAGILLPIHPDFIRLTPLNLLVSVSLVLWYHPKWDGRTWTVIGLFFLTGFFAEMYGVQTGRLFGTYSYGEVLGWKIKGTPLMIGVNWVMLAYCAGVASYMLIPRLHWGFRALLGAVLMVSLDLLIEPIAIRYEFWYWPGDSVPLRNYLGWFLVAFPLQGAFALLQGQTRNKVAIALFILQFLFFIILNLAGA